MDAFWLMVYYGEQLDIQDTPLLKLVGGGPFAPFSVPLENFVFASSLIVLTTQ